MKPLPKTFVAKAKQIAEAYVMDFQDTENRGPMYTPLTAAGMASSHVGLYFTEDQWNRHGERLKKVAFDHALAYHLELEPDRIAYTIGAVDLYDPPYPDGRIAKDEDGSVWKTLEEVEAYYESIQGTVTVLSDPPYEAPAGIYEVYLRAPYEECVKTSDALYAPLKFRSPIMRRIA